MKHCSRCRHLRPLDDFYRSSKSRDGRQSYCKSCVRDALRERSALKEKKRRVRPSAPEGFKHCLDCETAKPLDEFCSNKRSRDGRAAYCKECHNARTREGRERLYGGGRHYHLRRRYGIGADEVDTLLAGQGGVCAICGRVPTSPHVDHCHRTGRIRGILCGPCNQGLGQFQDDARVVTAAAEYLRLRSIVTTGSVEPAIASVLGLDLAHSDFRPQVFEPPADVYIELPAHRAA